MHITCIIHHTCGYNYLTESANVSVTWLPGFFRAGNLIAGAENTELSLSTKYMWPLSLIYNKYLKEREREREREREGGGGGGTEEWRERDRWKSEFIYNE